MQAAVKDLDRHGIDPAQLKADLDATDPNAREIALTQTALHYGDIMGRDCLVRYQLKGKTLAVASIYRDVASLKEEAAMERGAS